MTCSHFRDFMKEQVELMKRHVDRHKFYRGIPDRQQAEIDFIENFGGLLREMYCDTACPEHEQCQDYKDYLEREKLK